MLLAGSSFQHPNLLDTTANINFYHGGLDTRGASKILLSRSVSPESRASSCILLAVIRDNSQSNWQSENVKSDDNLDFQIKHTLTEIIVSLSNHDDEGDKNEPILHV